MSDENRVPYQRSRSRIRRRAAAGLAACCLALAACAGGDDTADPAPQVELRQRLGGADVADEVTDCVLQLATDELRRGPLDSVMEEELVASCERAQEVLDRSDTELDTWVGEPSGSGLAFGDDIADDQSMDYGDDPGLDRLWDGCEAGDGEACDRLFEQSPVGSEYEQFGLTCGNRDQVLDCRALGTEADTP